MTATEKQEKLAAVWGR